MADKEVKEKKGKGWGEDITQQMIHEIVPAVAKLVWENMPEKVRQMFSENEAWQLALPAISIAFARITPDHPPWDTVDTIRNEFFSEIRELAKKSGGKTTSVVSPRTASKAGLPALIFGLLNLNFEEAKQVADWLKSIYLSSADRGRKALEMLDNLTIRELMCFASLGDIEKTAYFESRIHKEPAATAADKVGLKDAWKFAKEKIEKFGGGIKNFCQDLKSQSKNFYHWVKNQVSGVWFAVKIGFLVSFAIFILAVALGLCFHLSWLVALGGIVFSFYILTVAFFAEIVARALLEVATLAKKVGIFGFLILRAVLKWFKIEIKEPGEIQNYEKLVLKIRQARSLVIPIAAFTFYLSLFPYWGALASVPIIAIALLTLFVMAMQWGYEVSWGRLFLYRLTFAALIIFAIALGAKAVLPNLSQAALGFFIRAEAKSTEAINSINFESSGEAKPEISAPDDKGESLPAVSTKDASAEKAVKTIKKAQGTDSDGNESLRKLQEELEQKYPFLLE